MTGATVNHVAVDGTTTRRRRLAPRSFGRCATSGPCDERYLLPVRRPGRGRSIPFGSRVGLGAGRDRHRACHRPADPVPPSRSTSKPRSPLQTSAACAATARTEPTPQQPSCAGSSATTITSQYAARTRANSSAVSATSSAHRLR